MPRTCNGELSLYALRDYIRFYLSSIKITHLPFSELISFPLLRPALIRINVILIMSLFDDCHIDAIKMKLSSDRR